MSWMMKLFETYENCAGHEPERTQLLMPISHTTQQAHIEIVLDAEGSFRRASVLLEKSEGNTMIPCTEESGGRAGSKPVNHPLCDKLQYVAGDFLAYGGEVTSGFAAKPEEPHHEFLNSLRKWTNSEFSHPKLNAILRYVEKGHLISDLVQEKILPVDPEGKLLKQWSGEKDKAPQIFKAIPNTQSPEDAFVRWLVEDPQFDTSSTWNDTLLVTSWVSYYQQIQSKHGYCMATGKETSLAVQHPAKLRHGGDKAKLISSNDTSGYTFRGRLIEASEAATVAFDVTQKAHNALRWLIQNQSRRAGDPTIVSWAVTGSTLPDLFKNSMEAFGCFLETEQSKSTDTAQAFALQLSRAIQGYRAKLNPTEDIIVMGLESATPGRMGITFYRKLRGSEFLERIETWHSRFAWPQNFGKESKFIGAPAPRDIAEAAYGKRLDEKLRKLTIERLLPCIVDKMQMPRDLLQSTIQKASNRVGLESWEWEKVLGIACALFKGYHIERDYKMALEAERKNRDYLYGRLLAVADNIENYALNMASERRETTAARLMQRFADQPGPTWRTIELALRPYMSRLRSNEKSGGFLFKRERLLDEIINSFEPSDFASNTRLSGEFLLGFHCQRQALWTKSHEDTEEKSTKSDSDQ